MKRPLTRPVYQPAPAGFDCGIGLDDQSIRDPELVVAPPVSEDDKSDSINELELPVKMRAAG